MDLEKFSILCITVVVFSLAVGCAVVDINQRNKISELIRSGSDPIEAMCAIAGVTDKTQAVCLAAAQKFVKTRGGVK